jgi:hypothetical protein
MVPLVVAALVAAASIGFFWGTVFEALGLIVAFSVALGAVFVGRAPGRRKRLVVDGRRVLLQGRLFGTVGELVGAGVDRAASRTHLTLVHRRRGVLFATVEAGDADAFVRGLGFAGEEAAAVFSATRPLGFLAVLFAVLTPFAALGGLVAWANELGAWFGKACVLALFAPLSLLALLLRVRVSVAEDGVCIETLGRTRFIGMTDLVEVETLVPQTLVRLTYTLRGQPRTDVLALPNADAAARFVRRLTTAKERQGSRGRDAHALLQRSSDAPDAWLSRIVRIADREGYREAGTSKERIEELLGNPTAEPTERAAAARILIGWDRTMAPRVRVVAETTSDPKLRESLVRLAEAENDDALDAALRRFAMTPR